MRASAPGSRFLDALFPPACLTCEAPVAEQGGLCAGCFGTLSFVVAPLCAHCGVPLPYDAAGASRALGLACPVCAGRPPPYGKARAALRYDAGAKALILPFKHRDRTELALPLARMMLRAGRELLAACDALVPVPLHRWRMWQRRHNQAALLAEALGRLAGRPVLPMALRRTRATAPLGDMGAFERRARLEGAFMAVPRQVVGRRLLLVDDVMTSGATAEACARVLLAAGAMQVNVLAAARVPDPRLEDLLA